MEKKEHIGIILVITALFSIAVAIFDIYKENKIDKVLQNRLNIHKEVYKKSYGHFEKATKNIYRYDSEDSTLIKIVLDPSDDGEITNQKLYNYFEGEMHKLKELDSMRVWELIDEGVKSKKEFAIYKKIDAKVKVVTFVPIQDTENNTTAAYVLAYTYSDKIYSILKKFQLTVYAMVAFFILINAVIFARFEGSYSLSLKKRYDNITNLLNKKNFLNIAKERFNALKGAKEDFSIVIYEIDTFKKSGNIKEYEAADIVLKELAGILKDSVRSIDKVGRLDTNKFIILLQANEKNVSNILEHICKKVEIYGYTKKSSVTITVTFGMSQFKPSDSFEELVKRAQKALSESKENGINQINIV